MGQRIPLLLKGPSKGIEVKGGVLSSETLPKPARVGEEGHPDKHGSVSIIVSRRKKALPHDVRLRTGVDKVERKLRKV